MSSQEEKEFIVKAFQKRIERGWIPRQDLLHTGFHRTIFTFVPLLKEMGS